MHSSRGGWKLCDYGGEGILQVDDRLNLGERRKRNFGKAVRPGVRGGGGESVIGEGSGL
jgi:hypothetical protein